MFLLLLRTGLLSFFFLLLLLLTCMATQAMMTECVEKKGNIGDRAHNNFSLVIVSFKAQSDC